MFNHLHMRRLLEREDRDIFCVGVNLIWPRTFKPANMLPAVVVAVACAFVM